MHTLYIHIQICTIYDRPAQFACDVNASKPQVLVASLGDEARVLQAELHRAHCIIEGYSLILEQLRQVYTNSHSCSHVCSDFGLVSQTGKDVPALTASGRASGPESESLDPPVSPKTPDNTDRETFRGRRTSVGALRWRAKSIIDCSCASWLQGGG